MVSIQLNCYEIPNPPSPLSTKKISNLHNKGIDRVLQNVMDM